MPDTMIPATIEHAQVSPASCGIMSGFRSPQIGKLVAARAKSSAKIKAIIKDKTADIPNKQGGRGYQYTYADLAAVLDAVEDAISEQGLAIFQTTQVRNNGTFLITTLAHESDQWIAAEIRMKSADAGPQVYGSEKSYLRRYAVLAALALAPEADDDGKAAQERADQQARQRPAQRDEAPRSQQSPPKHPERTQTPPVASGDPEYMPIPTGRDGPLYGRWTAAALEALTGKPEVWRREWLTVHEGEIETMRQDRPEYADRVVAAAISPDLQKAAE